MPAVGITTMEVNLSKRRAQMSVIVPASSSEASKVIGMITPDVIEAQTWLVLSQSALNEGWDHPQDAQYDAL